MYGERQQHQVRHCREAAVEEDRSLPEDEQTDEQTDRCLNSKKADLNEQTFFGKETSRFFSNQSWSRTLRQVAEAGRNEDANESSELSTTVTRLNNIFNEYAFLQKKV